MAKYKGHDRVVFLDGYVQGWADCRDSKAVRALDPNLTIHKPAGGRIEEGSRKPALRYTDAEKVAYRPGPVTGTELALIEMERMKRKYVTRYPTPAEEAILGPRVACPNEGMCPVAPGCHICGLTLEELKILKDRA